MPIAAGYSIDAYCECEQCVTNIDPVGRWCRQHMASAVGETYAECAAELRRRGWYLSGDRQHALAPGHVKPNKWEGE